MLPATSKFIPADWNLAQCRHAVASIDGNARVLSSNDRFRELEEKGLSIRNDRVVCVNTRDQSCLDELLRSAAGLSSARLTWAAMITSADGRPSLAAKWMPFGRRHQNAPVSVDRGQGEPRALLVIHTLLEDPPSGLQDILRSLGLTDTESKIAALVGQGHPPRDIGRLLQLAESTVRTRIKGVFSKLQLSRQSEITRLVTELKMFYQSW